MPRTPTRGSFRINLSLTDIKTGFVVAQSVARVRGDGVDTTPTAFYRDSPSLTKDRVVEGQIRTAQAPTGSSADEVYLSRIPINALVSEASKLYEAGNYAEALRYYDAAAARPEGAAAARVQRPVSRQYAARTHRRRRKGVREDRRPRPRDQQPVGQVSLPSRLARVPGRPEDQRPVHHVAAPHRARSRVVQGRASRSSVTPARPERSSSTSRLSLQRAVAMQRRIEGAGARRPWDACSRPAWASARTSSGRAPTICATRSTVASNSRCGAAD